MLIADPDTERLNDPETTTDPLSEFKKYMLKNPPKIPITSSLSDYGYKYAQDISQDTAQDASNNNSTSTTSTNSTTSTSKFFTKAKTKTKTKITTKTEGKENETNSINSEQKKLVASLNFGKKLEVTSR